VLIPCLRITSPSGNPASELSQIRGRLHYNHERPNMALGGITPKQRLAVAA